MATCEYGPSMVALNYLSERLGLAPSHFLDEPIPAWIAGFAVATARLTEGPR